MLKETERIKYPREATVAAAICGILFCFFGVIGNFITMAALVRCPKLRMQATTSFVLSLCFADLLFCSVNLPLTVSRYINEAWALGDVLCKLFPVLFYGNVAASLLSMMGITLNRYVLISCNQFYNKLYSTSSICLQLLFCWGFSFIIMAPPLFGIWGKMGLNPSTFSCTILNDDDGHSPKKIIFLLGFVLPCIAITLSYSCIYWKVRESRKQLKSHQAHLKNLISCINQYEISGRWNETSSGCQSYESDAVQSNERQLVEEKWNRRQAAIKLKISTLIDKRRANRQKEDDRLTKLMLLIFICFVVCFLPLMLMNVFDDDDVKYPVLHVVASILAWASSVINPIIYAVTNRQYRTAYKELFDCIALVGTASTDQDFHLEKKCTYTTYRRNNLNEDNITMV
ncbi:hypothetical protein FQA39_LY12279 [Lamprigera yunnana]|nr:hypothetical protein FQA39_LY12279 [Lamprigera yunnana]